MTVRSVISTNRMSPRTEAQFEEIRKKRKSHIMESALEIFAQDGYHKSSIAKIARTANISKGLLYNYFESKEDLLLQIIVAGTERIHGVFKDIEDELDTEEELKIFIKGGIEIIKNDPHFYKLMFTVLLQSEALDAMKNNYDRVMGGLMEDIAYYFKAKGDPYPMEKAFLLGAVMDGVGLQYILSPKAFDLERLEKIIFDLFK